MGKFSRAVFAAVIGGAFVSPAAAQTTDERIAELVVAWIAEQIPDFAPVVHEYGAACLTPKIVLLPEAAKQTILAAGGMELGLAALEVQDAALVDAFVPTLGECIDTLYIGDQIWTWLDGQVLNVTRETATTCLMGVVRPMPTEAKEIIYAAPDFQTGAQALMLDRPDLAGEFAAVLMNCL